MERVIKRLVLPISRGLNYITAFFLVWSIEESMNGKVAYLGSLGHLFYAKKPSESGTKT